MCIIVLIHVRSSLMLIPLPASRSAQTSSILHKIMYTIVNHRVLNSDPLSRFWGSTTISASHPVANTFCQIQTLQLDNA